jgi:hypothetical protein
MLKTWLAAAAGGFMLFGGGHASTTNDQIRQPENDRRGGIERQMLRNGSSTDDFGRREGKEGLRGMRTATTSSGTVDIVCIGTVVAAREASLSAANATYSIDINNAYNTRASALAAAYAQTGTDTVKKSVKTAWQTFGAANKLAKKNWQKTRESAWQTFKTSIKSCGAGASAISDANNASSETQGM